MWHSHTKSLNNGRVQKFELMSDDAPIPFADVITLWRTDPDFRSFFIALLADSSFSAFRWETPPITSANADRDFEFVLMRSDALDRPVDISAFASHFTDNGVETFPNLGGDAVMVVPCPVASASIYGHLASFIRNAPESQVHQLWQSVGAAMQERINDQPVWLNTAGMGVSWLHVRLDSRPKYYGFLPFKEFA